MKRGEQNVPGEHHHEDHQQPAWERSAQQSGQQVSQSSAEDSELHPGDFDEIKTERAADREERRIQGGTHRRELDVVAAVRLDQWRIRWYDENRGRIGQYTGSHK